MNYVGIEDVFFSFIKDYLLIVYHVLDSVLLGSRGSKGPQGRLGYQEENVPGRVGRPVWPQHDVSTAKSSRSCNPRGFC